MYINKYIYIFIGFAKCDASLVLKLCDLIFDKKCVAHLLAISYIICAI